MESFSLLDHPTSIQSLSSNLSDATRSHKPHHRPHRHHRHGKDAGQSASVSSRLKGASRSSPHSPTHNASGSNRSSVIRSEENGESIVPLRTLVRAEDVARERTHLKVQESELRSSLQALHDRSHKASRRLDDTYYTILEKVRGLRQHIENLRELSGLTKELHDTFSANTNDLAEEIGGQIDAFDNFTYQEEQLEKLENRIIVGREKARALNIRLCRARKVVEARSKVEAEWEGKTKSRRRLLCGLICGIIAIIVTAILIQQFRPMPPIQGPRVSLLASSKPLPDPVKQVLVGRSSVKRGPPTMSPPSLSTSASGDDPALRIFDEL